MQMHSFKQKALSLNSFIIYGALLGGITGFFVPQLSPFAHAISLIVINILKLISLPLIFFSITATISGMSSLQEMKQIGRSVIKYTLITTIIAATVALLLFLFINPVQAALICQATEAGDFGGYFDFMCKLIPSNIIQPFAENNVIGMMFIALGLSFATLTLPDKEKLLLHHFFSSFFAVLLRITQALVIVLPLGIWAFTAMFVETMKNAQNNNIWQLALYLLCIVSANLIQAFVMLPLFLISKGFQPIRCARGMAPALSIAFFSRSSNVALPLTIECTQKTFNVSQRLANITIPLCATINMNACAAFILITVMFVAQSNGMVFSAFEMLVWILIATVAAIGNAGVPMGCYFLSGALLAAMNVPLEILGIILPLYTVIDMVETAVNVWSDAVVTAMVYKETNNPNVSSTTLE